jgi:predicted acyltransferase
MILWAGGLSFLVLGLFYGVIDVANVRRWALPLAVIGTNALLAYVLDPLVYPLSRAIMWRVAPDWPSSFIKLCAAVIELGSLWLICWLLYRRRLFLRA